jgi:MYXO-CTERM domain-containing protein
VRRRAFILFVSAVAACTSPDAAESPEPTGSVASALAPTDPVSMAVSDSCTTASVRGLATQLVEQIQCDQPGVFDSIENVAGLSLGDAVFPWLQTPAAHAVVAAQKDRGTTMTINSALRTLPQQYLLYRWYQTNRCGISLAASPGKSNHESGLAVDIEDDTGWRSFLTAHDMKWLGSSDPVHFDYVGAGSTDIGGLSVKAFQKLWNRNHPEDPIDEDGAYGTETEKRLALAPVGGFPIGASCSAADAGAPPPPDAGHDAAPLTPSAAPRSPSADDGGCSCRAAPSSARGPGLALAALGLLLAAARRRGRIGASS